MVPETNTDGWNKWATHVLAEIKRGNETNERLEKKIDALNEKLIRHEVFIEEAKRKDILSQVSHNTKFRTNTKKLAWKLIGGAVASAGGITALVNILLRIGQNTPAT